MTRVEKRTLMLILAGFAAFGAWLGVANPTHMNFVCQEDGFVEYSQAFLYLFAAVLFARVAVHKGYRTLWHWGYAALFLLIAGEEVAWGERIFNFAPPAEVAAVNVQHELTLHNLDGVHQHHHLYAILVCTVICFVIPLTDRFVPAMRNLYTRFNMPVFPLWTWSLPLIGFAFMIVPRTVFHHVDFNMDEMAELYLAMAYFGFGANVYVGARERILAAPAAAPTRTAPVRLAA